MIFRILPKVQTFFCCKVISQKRILIPYLSGGWDSMLIHPIFFMKSHHVDILLMEEILHHQTKVWNLVNDGIFYISTGAGFLPSTVSLTSTQPVTGLETKAHFLTTRARPSSANLSSVCVFVSTSFQRLCGRECLRGIPLYPGLDDT